MLFEIFEGRLVRYDAEITFTDIRDSTPCSSVDLVSEMYGVCTRHRWEGRRYHGLYGHERACQEMREGGCRKKNWE